MIESTVIRGHNQAAGAKGGRIRKALVEVAEVSRTKSTPVPISQGRPVVFELTGSEVSDYSGANK
uniref:hypothetical protein n=1 Tax=Zymomonas mobilis TaxID=542 RepID=UPI00208DA8E6|nr:hypothetical protein [Zymomonas mobilis]